MGILSIVVPILVSLIGFLYWRNKRLRKRYTFIWKKASTFKPKEILNERPVPNHYFKRSEDDQIYKHIINGKNLLIIGPSLSGKSSSVYQSLKRLRFYDVLVPRFIETELENHKYPIHLKFWRKKIILIDDLHRFVELSYFQHLFSLFLSGNNNIIATCRSELELDKVKTNFQRHNISLQASFPNMIEFNRITEEIGKDNAKQNGIDWDHVIFNGTIGSIFMPLEEMERRFRDSPQHEKTILRILRELYICGIYKEKQVFPNEWIKRACQAEELSGEKKDWDTWFDSLKKKEYITIRKNSIWVEEAYLEHIFKAQTEVDTIDVLSNMFNVFKEESEVYIKIGHRATTNMARATKKVEYFNLAIKAFDKAIELDPKYLSAWSGKGDALMEFGQPEEAIKAFDKFIDINPKHGYPWSRKGFIISRLGQKEEAIKFFDKAIELDPETEYYWCGKGITLSMFGQQEEAIKAYEWAIKLRPNYSSAWYGKGIALVMSGQQEYAIKAFDKTIELDANYADPWYGKGTALMNLRHHEEAVKALTKATKLNPEKASAWSRKGYALIELGHQVEAIKAFDKAIELDPKDEDPWGGKGISLVKLGQHEEALKAFEMSTEVNPSHAESWNRKGDWLQVMGRMEGAIEAYQEALAIYTNSDDQEMISKINEEINQILNSQKEK